MFFWHCTISWPQVPPACLPPVPGKFEQHPKRMTYFHFKIHHTRQSSRPVILFRIFLVIPGPSHQVHAVVHLCFTTGMTRHSVCGHGGSPTGLCPASTAARSGYPMNSILFTVSGVCSSHGPGTQATRQRCWTHQSPQAERNSSHQGSKPAKHSAHLLAMYTHFLKIFTKSL